MRFTHRTKQLEASPIAEAHAWLEHRTDRRPLLDLSQAAPSYPTAPVIARRIAEVGADPDGGRYAPPPGLPALTSAFAEDIRRSYQLDGVIGPEHVLPTSGCNQAFCVTTSTLTEPGDEVILPVPYYFNHDMWLRLDGVTPRYLHPVDDTLVPSPEAAEALINPRTRAIVLVTPGNPTGVTIPPEVLAGFAELAQRHGIALIVDETYRNFRAGDLSPAEPSEPPHRLFDNPEWAETVVSLHSFSKDLAIPGYRVGALVAGPELIYEILKVLDCVQISAPRIGQEAVVTGLLEAGAWRAEQAHRIGRALEAFRTVMQAKPGGFELVTSGAFFGWVRHPFADLPTGEVVRRLVLDHDVLAIPGTAFTPADDRWLRFSYANLDPAAFTELGDRLNEAAP